MLNELIKSPIDILYLFALVLLVEQLWSVPKLIRRFIGKDSMVDDADSLSQFTAGEFKKLSYTAVSGSISILWQIWGVLMSDQKILFVLYVVATIAVPTYKIFVKGGKLNRIDDLFITISAMAICVLILVRHFNLM